MTVLLTDCQFKNSIYRALKRMMDIVVALIMLVFFWWLFLLCWLLVSLTSKGAGIFVQKRIGLHGKDFNCYKFRTMYSGVKQAGTHEMGAQAITPIGSFLRKTRLDELPQIFNILKGEMSLVGPRPCLPMQKELIQERKARGVHQIMPGVTGLAQISGVDMREPVKLAKIDAQYLNSRTLLLDIKIILITLIKRHDHFHKDN